jgi:hypothetical protein
MKEERRHSLGLFVTDISLGYVRYVLPMFLSVPWYMFGDHGWYSPVEFR